MTTHDGAISGDVTPNASNDTMEVTQEEAMEAAPGEASVFKLTIGPQSSYSAGGETPSAVGSDQTDIFLPSPRMNALLAVKNGLLYLYGGMYEAGDRQYTFSDFYSLDIHKLDEWNTIIENNYKDQVCQFSSLSILTASEMSVLFKHVCIQVFNGIFCNVIIYKNM